MRIQHNIMAMNAYRNYNNNTSALSKNLEKLSSGYKINRAGDDAAGLAISEKMRAQITGLEQAQDNAKSGKNLVQTAEGALQEVHDMLNRMVKLADQSANGTYDNEVDRVALQNEIVELKDEINRIADSANYNGIELLNGKMSTGGAMSTLGASVVTAGEEAISEIVPEFEIDLSGLTFTNTAASNKALTLKLTVAGQSITLKAASVASGATVNGTQFTSVTGTTAGKVQFNNKSYSVRVSGNKITFKYTDTQAITVGDVMAGGSITIGSHANFDISDTGFNTGIQVVEGGRVADAGRSANIKFKPTDIAWGDGTVIEIGGEKYTVDFSKDGVSGTTIGAKDLLDASGKLKTDAEETLANRLTEAAKNNSNFIVGFDGTDIILTIRDGSDLDVTDENLLKEQVKVSGAVNPNGGLILQIGDTSDSWNQVRLSIDDVHTTSLGIDGIDISSQTGAQAAIDQVKDAINTISGIRAKLGATQNRLDHTINNLSVMTENIQDAEATIRDTDVAEEMMAYTKNNILVQSAQAMLAQANQVPQGVLQLLQ